MTKHPRIPVEIDLGEGPTQTFFRLTTYAVAAMRERLGDSVFETLGSPERFAELTPMQRSKMDATLFWALLLHDHEDLTVKQVADNLPVNGEEYQALAMKAVEAMAAGQPPPNPTKGSEKKPTPAQKTLVNGGTENASGGPSSKSSSDSRQMSITH